MLITWLGELGHFLRLVLLTWDAPVSHTATGLEITYMLCYVVTFLSGAHLHRQAWIDRSYTLSASAATRRYAALTHSTANHLLLITGLIMFVGLVGFSIGLIASTSAQSANMTEAQRTVAALTRLAFVIKAIALTGVNLTLLHWRHVATKRARG